MKHLLNNLSEEEKTAIREQHSGGMKIMTENFGKLIWYKFVNTVALIINNKVIIKIIPRVLCALKLIIIPPKSNKPLKIKFFIDYIYF